ncbi:hypothetical protein GGR56DRAFT_496327 [Xylariaceae sp. FL0804]|nr:hypothetical protein GGR56DRAFT_496327 [Xylariaceae sp. FL0804]
MPDDLRKQLGKSQVEAQSTSTAPWPPHVWRAAFMTYQSGWKRPESRYPVVVEPGAPISTPEELKKLAGMPSTPELVATHTEPFLEGDPSHIPITVNICDVDYDQICLLQDRTTWSERVVLFNGAARAALEVYSLEPNGRVLFNEAWLVEVRNGTSERGGEKEQQPGGEKGEGQALS